MKEEELGLRESILNVLLHHSRYNDSKRIFAGLRKPSKITVAILGDLIEVAQERARL